MMFPALLDPMFLAQQSIDDRLLAPIQHSFNAKELQVFRRDCGVGKRGANNGAQLVNDIESFARGPRPKSKVCYILLNEVEQLAPEVRDSLRSLMDRHYRTLFVFTTNNLSKIETAAVNRCHVLDFGDAGAEAWAARCEAILRSHDLPVLPAAELKKLHIGTNGSARDVMDNLITSLNSADRNVVAYQSIDEQHLRHMLFNMM
jgi:DNA polymerase III delta prime subunit